jgi:CIC family chloride channel protein
LRFPLDVQSQDPQVADRRREYTKLGLLAIVIGIVAGILAVLFRLLIEGVTENGFQVIGGTLSALGPARYALIPAVGGLIVGPLIYWGAREAKGSGVPEVIDAVTRYGGRIRFRVVFFKALASAITLGSGGSAGKEGPIVHMGSAIGSNVAQTLKLNKAQTKILLGCGAAGGIAATFNTPIAGVLFAMELILMEFKTRSFIPLVISSVIATLVAPGFDAWITGSWSGNPWSANPAFDVPTFTLVSPWELAAYLVLGIVCGVVSLLFIKVLYTSEDLFESLKVKPWLKPAIGGLLLGVLGIVFFQVHGVGYGHIEKVLNDNWPLTLTGVLLMGVLAIVKILGVSLTLGSGGSGGVFAPSLFIGCMAGGAFGGLVHNIFPDDTAQVGAYALVGMGALVAATTRGTLTAILMIFEMTRVYDIILPLLFACVIADLVASVGSAETIYTKKLLRRGVNIVHDLEPNVMQLFTVREVMVPREDVITISPEDQLHKVVAIIRRTGHNGFPVVDENGELLGVVTHEDSRTAHNKGELFSKASDLMTTDMVTVTPYETGEAALRKMGDRLISHLPVVDPYDPKKLMGWISKGDLVFAYEAYHRKMEAPFSEAGAEVATSETEEAPSSPEEPPRPLLHRLFGRGGKGQAPSTPEPLDEVVVIEEGPALETEDDHQREL